MLQGAIAGSIAGLVASWAMESFQAAWAGAVTSARSREEVPEEEPATVRVGSAIAEPVLDRGLTDEEKPAAGEVVHYAFGGMNGALYGALADALPPVRAANGMLFGAILWLSADEIGLWKMGLARKPTEFPTSTHVYALASHLVYGFTLEAVRRLVRPLVV